MSLSVVTGMGDEAQKARGKGGGHGAGHEQPPCVRPPGAEVTRSRRPHPGRRPPPAAVPTSCSRDLSRERVHTQPRVGPRTLRLSCRQPHRVHGAGISISQMRKQVQMGSNTFLRSARMRWQNWDFGPSPVVGFKDSFSPSLTLC